MIRLLYLSHFRPEMMASDISDIMKTSTERNASLGVTGCLLATDGQFLQLLEGPQPAIEELMRSIRADPRHMIDIETAAEACTTRCFPDWSMGYAALPSGHVLFNTVIEDGSATLYESVAKAINRRISLYQSLNKVRIQTKRFLDIADDMRRM
ncbi:BLUF domain-containing protein [Sagittula sp. SSi028]|uniref:BLUF domain-containing protein n=1 Tax=Sagittula sp. SSi028 TaxID=3400636 RepID=UPI003AF87E54